MSTVLSCFPIFYSASIVGYLFILGVVGAILYKILHI